MKVRIKPVVRRVTRCLVIGFIASWIVAWSVAIIPHYSRFGFNAHRGVASFSDGADDYFYLTLEDYRWLGVKEEAYRVRRTTEERVNERRVYPPLILPTNRIWWTLMHDPSHEDHPKVWRMLELQFRDMSYEPDRSSFSVIQYGWPFLSHKAQGAVHRMDPGNPLLTGNEYQMTAGAFSKPLSLMKTTGGMSRSGSPSGQYSATTTVLATRTLFPYSPIWPGLALNTIFFAILIPLAYSTPRAFRHARRMHKGLCPICKYDLVYDNSLGCPECGWHKQSGTEESA